MRKRIYIPQGAIAAADLVSRVNTDCWILLDYIRHWPDCKNIRRRQWDGLDFFWLDYETACSELPILFPRNPKLTTKINKLTLLVRRLRAAELLLTRRLGPRCYMRLTALATDLYQPVGRQFLPSIDTPSQDVQITESRDADVIESRDSRGSVHIRKEQLDKKTVPHKPEVSRDMQELSESIARIFGRTHLEHTELKLLDRLIPIPAEEVNLVSRYHELPYSHQDFRLTRRRQSARTLLTHWSEVVDQASSYFKERPWTWRKEWGPIPRVRCLAASG